MLSAGRVENTPATSKRQNNSPALNAFILCTIMISFDTKIPPHR
jgi:hypothetical protein